MYVGSMQGQVLEFLAGVLGRSPRKLFGLAILNLENGRSLHEIMQTYRLYDNYTSR